MQNTHYLNPKNPYLAYSSHAHHDDDESAGIGVWAKRALWTVGGTATALAAAPILMPLAGVGKFAAMTATQICGTGEATGIAGAVSGIVSEVPLVGSMLAAGGIFNALAAGGIAVAGLYIADKLDEEHDCNDRIQWGTVVRWAALTTSFLVALPAILPAITMGLTFLGHWGWTEGMISQETSHAIIGFSTDVIGKIGAEGAAGASLAGGAASLGSLFVAHLASCGVAMGIGASAIGHGVHEVARGKHICPNSKVNSDELQHDNHLQQRQPAMRLA